MEKDNQSALRVNKGIEQPPSVNPYFNNFYKSNKVRKLSKEEYLSGILSSDVTILSQAITLIESSRAEHRELARTLVEQCQSVAKESMRIGITGVPGAGKSTFIETFGKLFTSEGHKLAVLAIDPSSEKSRGSILGDKTRMESLSTDKNAFIRPSPSGGSLGGVARKTRESIVLCEAAGYDVIFIETVGVGQSETAVHSMSDFFLLLMLSGAGDELQGIKRGIMEMSDLIAITKADGNNIEKAFLAKALYSNALNLFPPTESGWIPTALTSSAVTGKGLDEVKKKISDYFNLVRENGYYYKRREEQSRFWMYEAINEEIKHSFYENPEIKAKLKEYENLVIQGKKGSFTAASELLKIYGKKWR